MSNNLLLILVVYASVMLLPVFRLIDYLKHLSSKINSAKTNKKQELAGISV